MRAISLLVCTGLAALSGCEERSPVSIASSSVSVEARNQEPIQPLVRPRISETLARLGSRLFSDQRLSGDGSIACASCHDPGAGGDDGRVVSVGVERLKGEINAPTVFNASTNVAQFWDGRAASLSTQLDGPLLSAVEMASSWTSVLSFLRQDAEYAQLFAASFPDGVTQQNVRSALVEYQRHLTCTGSRFDRFLTGDLEAITSLEKRGYGLFKDLGCSACHQGANVGGNMFQQFGLFGDYFADRGNKKKSDLGRFNVTGLEEDRYAFKVPSLRHASQTAPYFHDGQTATLSQAVQTMAKYQLGRSLPPADVKALVAFIGSLAGDVPVLGAPTQ